MISQPVKQKVRSTSGTMQHAGASLVGGIDTCAKALQPKVVDKAPAAQRLCSVGHRSQAGSHHIPACTRQLV